MFLGTTVTWPEHDCMHPCTHAQLGVVFLIVLPDF